MKRIFYLTVVLFATFHAFGQDPSIDAGPDQDVCPPECVDITAIFEGGGGNTSDYDVEVIPFAPDPYEGTLVPLFDDDMSASNDVEIVELMFTFSNDCWIKITDATGNDIAYGIKAAGRVMPVSGQPPFSIILGTPTEVSISYAGADVDLSFLPRNRTGRFTLPLQE